MNVLETTMIIARQIVIMFLMMGLGFALTKTGFLTEAFNQMLSKFLLNIVVPMLLISSFQIERSSELSREIVIILGLSVAVQLVCILIGRLLFGRGGDAKTRIAKLGVGYCNCGFMGLPLLQAVFGASGVIYSSVYVAIFNIATWTHCYATVRDTKIFEKDRPLYKAFLVPSIIAAAVGIVLYFLPFRLPELILAPMEAVGATNTPLAMLVLGGFLAKLDFRKALGGLKTMLSYLGRLVICPAVCAVLLVLLPISSQTQTAMFIISAMPASTSLGLQAALYSDEGTYGAQVVAMSTLLSVVTIPLMTALFTWLQSVL